MISSPKYAEIILPLPLHGTFTYALPAQEKATYAIGKRVVVQFGKKRLYTGILHSFHNNKPADFEVKPILTVLDDVPIVNSFQLKLWEWGANYYLCSLGEFYKASVPTALRLESETKVLPINGFEEFDTLNGFESSIFILLKENESLSINELTKATGAENILPLIRVMMDKGAVIIQEEVKSKYKPKFEKIIEPAYAFTQKKLELIEEELQRAKKQKELFLFFITNYYNKKAIPVSKTELIDKAASTAANLKALINRGILVEKNIEISRLKAVDSVEIEAKKTLNNHQQIAYAEIKQKFEEKDVVLLHGVTSSGKTEVYIHLINEIIEKGKQVLYLLPEIALTSQIIQRLKLVFGDTVGVYHSKFSGNERVEVWNNLLKNDESSYKIIIGVRSSILLPFSNLGLIIVDEEHENTYKQFDPAPRYNARDLSIVLAKFHDAKVLLGTATPSIESYHNTKNGRYALVELNKRHMDIKLPKVVIADVRKAYKKKQMRAHFTPELLDNIELALENKEQVILFQNRRGFSPYLECASCGSIPGCKFCDVSLTYHKRINKLVCHYCGYQINSIHRCEDCKEPNMQTKGFGTEKIEEEIAIIFPDAKIGRLDLDSTKGKHGHEVIINDFQNHRIDILIGTQMVSKGLDFDEVSLVGILNADNMLRFPDFRAYERSYQLMAQVSGRAGRKNKQGKVIIQTSDTEHYIIKQVIKNDYEGMFLSQASERKIFLYPPFTRLIRITLKHRDQETVLKASMHLAQSFGKIPRTKILGPSTPLVNRVQNMYIQQIVIKLEKGDKLVAAKKDIQEKCNQLVLHKAFKQVVLIKDVDPA